MKDIPKHAFVGSGMGPIMDRHGKWIKNPNKVETCVAILPDGIPCRAIRATAFHHD